MPQEQENLSQEMPEKSRDEAKKPYLKPSFRHEKIFETMALQCGKVQSTQFSCHFNRKNS